MLKAGNIVETIFGRARITYVRYTPDGGIIYETTIGHFSPDEVELIS